MERSCYRLPVNAALTGFTAAVVVTAPVVVETGAIEGDPSAFYPDEDSDESDNS